MFTAARRSAWIQAYISATLVCFATICQVQGQGVVFGRPLDQARGRNGLAQPNRIPGQVPVAVNPAGKRLGVEARVLNATNYTGLYQAFRRDQLGAGLPVANASSLQLVIDNQAAANTSFVAFSNGVAPQLLTLQQFIQAAQFNGPTTAVANITAGSASRSVFVAPPGQRVQVAGINQATAIARGVFNPAPTARPGAGLQIRGNDNDNSTNSNTGSFTFTSSLSGRDAGTHVGAAGDTAAGAGPANVEASSLPCSGGMGARGEQRGSDMAGGAAADISGATGSTSAASSTTDPSSTTGGISGYSKEDVIMTLAATEVTTVGPNSGMSAQPRPGDLEAGISTLAPPDDMTTTPTSNVLPNLSAGVAGDLGSSIGTSTPPPQPPQPTHTLTPPPDGTPPTRAGPSSTPSSSTPPSPLTAGSTNTNTTPEGAPAPPVLVGTGVQLTNFAASSSNTMTSSTTTGSTMTNSSTEKGASGSTAAGSSSTKAPSGKVAAALMQSLASAAKGGVLPAAGVFGGGMQQLSAAQEGGTTGAGR